jgi:hypothetical protein
VIYLNSGHRPRYYTRPISVVPIRLGDGAKNQQTMKTLIQYANKHGLFVAKITYRAAGTKLTGYDLVRVNDSGGYDIIAQLEPKFYTNGDRWMLCNNGVTYLKRLTDINKVTLKTPQFPNTLNVTGTDCFLNPNI